MTTLQVRPRAPGPFAAFRIRHFGFVWFSGLVWHMCRWGVAFLGTYLINDMTGSPRLVQLAGTTLYAPLLLGGILGGVVSDRWDRLATVRMQMVLLVPLSTGIGLLVRADAISVGIIYAFMFVVGLGWVSDMTSRRALILDLVGSDRLDKAMAMESLRGVPSAQGLLGNDAGVIGKASGHFDVGLLKAGAVLQTGGLIEISKTFLEGSGQGVGFGAIPWQQALVDVEHFAAYFLHRAMDEVAGEGPVACIHQLGQFRQALLGCLEFRGIAADHRHLVGGDGRCTLGCIATSHQAEAKTGAETEGGEATQSAQHHREMTGRWAGFYF